MVWWTLIESTSLKLFSILFDRRSPSCSPNQHSHLPSPLTLYLSRSLPVSAEERQRNFDLPSLSPKIKYPVCLRKSCRINMPKPLSSWFHEPKSCLCMTALWSDFFYKVSNPLKERSISLWYAGPDSRLISSTHAGGLLSVSYHQNHFSYWKKESRAKESCGAAANSGNCLPLCLVNFFKFSLGFIYPFLLGSSIWITMETTMDPSGSPHKNK